MPDFYVALELTPAPTSEDPIVSSLRELVSTWHGTTVEGASRPIEVVSLAVPGEPECRWGLMPFWGEEVDDLVEAGPEWMSDGIDEEEMLERWLTHHLNVTRAAFGEAVDALLSGKALRANWSVVHV